MMYFARLAVEQWVVRRYKLLNDLRSRIRSESYALELHSIVTALSAEMMSSI